MMLRLGRRCRIGVVSGDYVRVREHPASMSRRAEPMERNFRIVLDKAFRWAELRHRYFLKAKAHGRLHWGSSWTYFQEGRRWRALRRLLLSLLRFPLPGGPDFCRRKLGRLRLLFRIMIGEMLFGFLSIRKNKTTDSDAGAVRGNKARP